MAKLKWHWGNKYLGTRWAVGMGFTADLLKDGGYRVEVARRGVRTLNQAKAVAQAMVDAGEQAMKEAE